MVAISHNDLQFIVVCYLYAPHVPYYDTKYNLKKEIHIRLFQYQILVISMPMTCNGVSNRF